MKNLFHYRSFIKVGIIGVVMAFMASQITEVYAANAANAAKAFVGKTGQTIKFLDGDDGDLQAGAARRDQRFKDNNNGTITDKLTNLIWDKDANRFGQRTWAEALTYCNQLADNGGDLADGSQPGDWYLANRSELISLHHMGVFNPAVPDTKGTGQWSQGDPFNNVQSSFYWSSTTVAVDSTFAWFVRFFNGVVTNSDKADVKHVWCVRGGP
jgi:hypothetical protein